MEHEISNLYNALDNRDQTIAELEKRLETILYSSNAAENDQRLITDLDNARNEIIQQRQVISELEEQVGRNVEQNGNDAAELKNMRDQVDKKNKIIESQRKQICDAKEEANHVTMENKSGKGELYRLERENLRMRELIQELEENEENLVEEVGVLANERYALELKNQEKVREVEELNVQLDGTSNYGQKCESENELLLEKIRMMEEKEVDLMQKREQLKRDHLEETQALKDELERERSKNHQNIVTSSGKTLKEEQEAQINHLKTDINIARAKAEKLETDNKIMKRDVDSACCALQEARLEQAEVLLDMETKQARTIRELKGQIRDMELKVESATTSSNDFEEDLRRVKEQLKAEEERNARYAEGNGLEDMARYQKQLEADIQRREFDRKRLIVEIGQKNDDVVLLKKTCEVLKSGDVDAVNMIIDENELKGMLEQEENSLQAQNRELCRQIDSLEDDRNRLLKRLRTNAAIVGEDGLRILGLSSYQMEQVIEFAGHLRDGEVKLPMNDKSMELSTELSSIRVLRQSDLCTIDRLERELEAMKMTYGFDDNGTASELRILRESIKEIQLQNDSLQQQLQAMTENRVKQVPCVPENVLEMTNHAKEKLERIIGECIDATVTPSQISIFIQEHEKISDELIATREARTRAIALAPGEEEVRMLNNTKQELERKIEMHQGRISELEAQLLQSDKNELEEELKSMTKRTIVSTRNARVQVDIDRSLAREKEATTRRLQSQMECTKRQLMSSHQKLLTAQAKIKILQNTLKQHSLVHDDKMRISMAHIALKTLLEEKNKLIAKYREKDVTKKKVDCDVATRTFKESRDEIKPATDGLDSPTVGALVEKLEVVSNLVKEKDSIIKVLKYELNDEREALKKSSMRLSKTCDALQHSQEHNDHISNEKNILQQSIEIELRNVHDLNNQLALKDERIECLSKSIHRLKNALRQSNDEKSRLAAVEADLRRTNCTLSACRRSKDNSKKALAVRKMEHERGIEQISKLKGDIIRLENQVVNMRDVKSSLEKRLKRATIKIRELHDAVGSVYDESKIESIEEDYKITISKLKLDNSSLRGAVAAMKLKQPEMHESNKTDSSKRRLDATKKNPWGRVSKAEKFDKTSSTNPTKKQTDLVERNLEIYKMKELDCKKLKEVITEKQRIISELERKAEIHHQEITTKDDLLMSSQKENEDHQRNCKETQDELLRLQRVVQQFSSHQSNDEEITCLKIKLSALNEEKSTYETGKSKLEAALQEKSDENERLRNELNSFDLEFFEQLEDLKYNYNQAKLQGYAA